MAIDPQRHRRNDSLSSVFVHTAQARSAFQRIDELLKNGWEEHFCRALLMLGPSRAGKTHIIKNFIRNRAAASDDREAVNIVFVEVPAACSLNVFATDLLTALDDPDPSYGPQAEKTRRIVEAVKEAEVDLIVIDEMQRLIDVNTDRVKRDVANWLTALLNQRVCPLLLVGEQSAERVFEGNTHLQGRTLGQVTIDAYDWEIAAHRDEFRAVLHGIDKRVGLDEQSGLGELSGLAELDIALRIHIHSRGLLGQAARLIEQARAIAVRLNRPVLTRDIFVRAVNELRIGDVADIANPFDNDRALPVTRSSVSEPRRTAVRGRDRVSSEAC